MYESQSSGGLTLSEYKDNAKNESYSLGHDTQETQETFAQNPPRTLSLEREFTSNYQFTHAYFQNMTESNHKTTEGNLDESNYKDKTQTQAKKSDLQLNQSIRRNTKYTTEGNSFCDYMLSDDHLDENNYKDETQTQAKKSDLQLNQFIRRNSKYTTEGNSFCDCKFSDDYEDDTQTFLKCEKSDLGLSRSINGDSECTIKGNRFLGSDFKEENKITNYNFNYNFKRGEKPNQWSSSEEYYHYRKNKDYRGSCTLQSSVNCGEGDDDCYDYYDLYKGLEDNDIDQYYNGESLNRSSIEDLYSGLDELDLDSYLGLGDIKPMFQNVQNYSSHETLKDTFKDYKVENERKERAKEKKKCLSEKFSSSDESFDITYLDSKHKKDEPKWNKKGRKSLEKNAWHQGDNNEDSSKGHVKEQGEELPSKVYKSNNEDFHDNQINKHFAKEGNKQSTSTENTENYTRTEDEHFSAYGFTRGFHENIDWRNYNHCSIYISFFFPTLRNRNAGANEGDENESNMVGNNSFVEISSEKVNSFVKNLIDQCCYEKGEDDNRNSKVEHEYKSDAKKFEDNVSMKDKLQNNRQNKEIFNNGEKFKTNTTKIKDNRKIFHEESYKNTPAQTKDKNELNQDPTNVMTLGENYLGKATQASQLTCFRDNISDETCTEGIYMDRTTTKNNQIKETNKQDIDENKNNITKNTETSFQDIEWEEEVISSHYHPSESKTKNNKDDISPSIPTKAENHHVASQLLQQDEIQLVLNLLGSNAQCLSMAVAQLWISSSKTGLWIYKQTGIVCFVEDIAKNLDYLKVLDVQSCEVCCEEAVHHHFVYEIINDAFHTFLGKEHQFGLLYIDEEESGHISRHVIDRVLYLKEKREARKDKMKHQLDIEAMTTAITFIEKLKKKYQTIKQKTKQKRRLTIIAPVIDYNELMEIFEHVEIFKSINSSSSEEMDDTINIPHQRSWIKSHNDMLIEEQANDINSEKPCFTNAALEVINLEVPYSDELPHPPKSWLSLDSSSKPSAEGTCAYTLTALSKTNVSKIKGCSLVEKNKEDVCETSPNSVDNVLTKEVSEGDICLIQVRKKLRKVSLKERIQELKLNDKIEDMICRVENQRRNTLHKLLGRRRQRIVDVGSSDDESVSGWTDDENEPSSS